MMPDLRGLIPMGGLRALPNLSPVAQATGYQAPPSALMQLLQRPGLSQALMAAGSSLLQARDQPGATLGGALGRALPVGMQAYQQGQERDRLNALIDSLPPETQQLIRALPDSQKGPALLSMMQPKKPLVVSENDRILDPDTMETIVPAAPDAGPPRAADLRTAMEFMGLDPSEPIPPENLDAVRAEYSRIQQEQNPPGATTNVNLPGNTGAAAEKRLQEGFDAARTAQANIARLTRAMEIAETPEFESVTGRLGSFKEQMIAVSKEIGLSEGEAIAAADEYQSLVGALAVNELQKFGAGSGLSDRDLAEAKGLVGANRSMDARALRAILTVVKNAQQDVIDAHRDFGNRAARLGVDPRVIELWSLPEGDEGDVLSKFGIVKVR